MVAISGKRTFNRVEVGDVLPIIRRLTEAAQYEVSKFSSQLELVQPDEVTLRKFLEDKLNNAVETWHKKVERLGGEPQGLWIVDFDNGQGYFCWKYPEVEVGYWHGYDDGFSKRIALQKDESTHENCHCTDQPYSGGL